jgi:hypothetical protein
VFAQTLGLDPIVENLQGPSGESFSGHLDLRLPKLK